ncbi:hypothetical protein [Albidovulum sediminis]|uniref:YD repeat-containing protein n=1 Tax=Albidovulum sediminis TaxID=3066345 RepID=A0ABT2NQC6_9RHOB|nr:hypothetical protein [Defluviimonas sediminis]MCT8330900.1 hypothetical protein [Defluviimonas sediminis]
MPLPTAASAPPSLPPQESKAYAGRNTAYEYGADGARLKKIETDPVTGA